MPKNIVFLIGPKTIGNLKKTILGTAQGRPKEIYARIWRIRGPRAAVNYQGNRCVDDKKHEVWSLSRRWTVGPAIFVICYIIFIFSSFHISFTILPH